MSEEKLYTTETSDSGKYTLLVSSIATKPGCWNYTKGVVKEGDRVIAEINRNYSSFPFLFIEGHPNGHDYLVCGADYQGQTVIELDTGKRRDYLPTEAADGAGFCWTEYFFEEKHQLLVVDGCIWACPYEFRFYDFSDPMEKGWPPIEFEDDELIDSEGVRPYVRPDGTITTSEARSKGNIAGKDYMEFTDEDEEKVVVATKTFRLEGGKFVKIGEWIDETEAKRRAEHKARMDEWERKWREYKETNPIFLYVMQRSDVAPFKREEYCLSIGQCHDNWHPTEKFDDARVCMRLLERPRNDKGRMQDTGWSVTVEWGRNHAPVKLIIHKDGQEFETTWYEHSVDGMTKALDHAASVVG